jgi:isopentenyl phosphate kinase
LSRLLVLKLGGSLITDKSKPYCLREEKIKSVSKEIKECLDGKLVDQLIIVHGVGSYGHPPVIEHKLHKGFIDPGQLMPISRTQSKVNELRAYLTSSLQDAGLPVNLFHTSSIASAEKGWIVSMHLDAVRGFLKIGMVPVLGGDMVQDSAMGFSVGSGDRVAVILAQELHATDLVFATDVAGVIDSDPKLNKGAKLIRELSLGDIEHLSAKSAMADASGAMRGKLANLEGLRNELRDGLRAEIISMMEPGRLKGLLSGENVEGTRILP